MNALIPSGWIGGSSVFFLIKKTVIRPITPICIPAAYFILFLRRFRFIMKYRLLLFCLLAFLSACEKDTPPPYVDPDPDPIDTIDFAGTYEGWVEKHSAGVDSFGVYKNDTAFFYSVKIVSEGFRLISIAGSDSPPIPVDSNGFFAFNEFNHNIDGNFKGDSLYLFTEAISGSYEPPQFYDNTQMKFAGKKVE